MRGNAERPRYKHTDIKTQVRAVERKPVVVPVYQFSGRTFFKKITPAQ